MHAYSAPTGGVWQGTISTLLMRQSPGPSPADTLLAGLQYIKYTSWLNFVWCPMNPFLRVDQYHYLNYSGSRMAGKVSLLDVQY